MCEEEQEATDEVTGIMTVCNIITFVIGAAVFGLALGTVKDDVFVLEKTSNLAPIFRMACADVAVAVVICITSALGAITLVYRTPKFHIMFIFVLVVTETFQICTGIATLIVASQKVWLWKKFSTAFCELNYTPDEVAYISQGGRHSDKKLKDEFYPTQYRNCEAFNDLMTPAGALLIVDSFFYLLFLCMAIRLYIQDQERRAERGTRNDGGGGRTRGAP